MSDIFDATVIELVRQDASAALIRFADERGFILQALVGMPDFDREMWPLRKGDRIQIIDGMASVMHRPEPLSEHFTAATDIETTTPITAGRGALMPSADYFEIERQCIRAEADRDAWKARAEAAEADRNKTELLYKEAISHLRVMEQCSTERIAELEADQAGFLRLLVVRPDIECEDDFDPGWVATFPEDDHAAFETREQAEAAVLARVRETREDGQ